MKFCAKLCGHINFEHDAIQPCCDVHYTRVPRFQYSGGPVDLEKYALHIQNVATELQGDTSLCKGCPDLVEYNDRNFVVEMQFNTVLINMHRHLCNCRCVYCSLWKTPKRSYPILPAIKSLVKQKALAPHALVSWGGGEPSILKEFDETFLWIFGQGFQQHVFTNAIRYSPGISTMLNAKIGTICISLDSASPKVYHAVKQVDKYKQVVENIKRYINESNNPSAIYLKYIIFEKNNSINEINNFLTMSSTLGISNVQFSFDFREVNGSGLSQKTLLAAAFFEKKAESLGLNFEKFYINDQDAQQIAAMKETL